MGEESMVPAEGENGVPLTPSEVLRLSADYILQSVHPNPNLLESLAGVLHIHTTRENAIKTAEGFREAAEILEKDPSQTDPAIHALEVIYKEGKRYEDLIAHPERLDDPPLENEAFARQTVGWGRLAEKALRDLKAKLSDEE